MIKEIIQMFKAILTYFAVKQIVTFVVLAAMMIGLLAVVCVTAVFASQDDSTNENTHVTAVLSDNNSDTREFIGFDSRTTENLGMLNGFGAMEK